MIQRDYIMRQVHQLAQALARLFGMDAAGRQSEGTEWLSNEVQSVTGMTLDRLRNATDAELTEACSRDGEFIAELAVALADILKEHSRILEATGNGPEQGAAWERALVLYSMARDAGGILPMDVLVLLAD